MLREAVLQEETLSADVADGPFPGVPPDVRLQVVALLVAVRALWTLVRPHICVDPHVHLQVVGPVEALVTHAAVVRLLVRVVPLVHVQIRRPGKGLFAEPATVRLLSPVTPHVHDQKVLPHEPNAALGAHRGPFGDLFLRVLWTISRWRDSFLFFFYVRCGNGRSVLLLRCSGISTPSRSAVLRRSGLSLFWGLW